MDKYRQTLVGRSLAEVLKTLEDEREISVDLGDLLFQYLDDMIEKEMISISNNNNFTNEKLQFEGMIQHYNRYQDQWSIQSTYQSTNLQLDQEQLFSLPFNTNVGIDILLKFHTSHSK